MKKIIKKEVQICDACQKETYAETCLNCGVEHCWECRKEHGVEYTHALYFSGSGDGYYCNSCHNELSAKPTNKLFNAYSAIADLKQEGNKWQRDFKARSDKAEALLKELSGM